MPGQGLRGIARGLKTLFQPRQAPGHLPLQGKDPAPGLFHSFLLLITASGGIRKDPGQVLQPLGGFGLKPFLTESPPTSAARAAAGKSREPPAKKRAAATAGQSPPRKVPGRFIRPARTLFFPQNGPLARRIPQTRKAPNPSASPPFETLRLISKTLGPGTFPGAPTVPPLLRVFPRRGPSGMMLCGDPASQKRSGLSHGKERGVFFRVV